MKRWLKRTALVLALVVLGLTFLNASWLAPEPEGGVKLVAHRGVYQLFDQTNLDPQETCTATRIEQPVHDYLENTVRSMQKARELGAQMVEVDIAPTADARIAVFHDWTLDCRTNGSGNVRDRTMAELKALDIGYGYTADGGRTFPFRGKGVGAMPTREEVIAALPDTPIIFNFKSDDPAEADLLARALRESGRDVEGIGDAFYGGPTAPIERIRRHSPKSWAWSKEEAHGGRVLMVGKVGVPAAPGGLSLPEELGEVPGSFNGYLWVEDIWTVGPALYPSLDRWRPDERARA